MILLCGIDRSVDNGFAHKRASSIVDSNEHCILARFQNTQKCRLRSGFAADNYLSYLINIILLADIRYLLKPLGSRDDDYLVNMLAFLECGKRMGNNGSVAKGHHYLVPAHALRVARSNDDDRAEITGIGLKLKKLINYRHNYLCQIAELSLCSTCS